MESSILTVAYLAAGVLFILSLGGLSRQDTARRGNLFGMIGMVIAIVATLFHPRVEAFGLTGGAVIVGALVGAALAARVAMTAMPELVAMLHSFVGLAAVLVGISTYLDPGKELHGAEHVVHQLEIWADVAIGAITFTGSVVAWAKLRGSVSGKPLLLPGRHLLNLAMVLGILGLAVPFTPLHAPDGLTFLLAMTAIASILGIHLVMAIGGADMPVVVSLLNSYSGWAAAAAGFMLENDLLIITGALVGSSGAILSYIMCEAMNRSIWNVVFGGFGAAPVAPSGEPQEQGEIQPIECDDLADCVADAESIVIVPGYGMAVARAQNAVHDFTRLCQEQGKTVRFAIHPVAGRLPGHMNVLLAEAGVSYEIVLEMDEINDDFPHTDVVLVIGANDIVNPGAETDASSPIYGMPVLKVWQAKKTIVLKRGMGSGYAGVENPLFFKENNHMYFGDARASMEALVTALRGSKAA
ncbi:MAG: NAD(P)(+) transhydrogenase (Re/Si-specific) subunit beta [Deltaproteobacteria bacterium]|nr:MAG: NAD(P)(+) transhydrogenase (Re/Si-specific) subunit beta [Deltaproteobacteria bacterium]